jgi:hypothetical protein
MSLSPPVVQQLYHLQRLLNQSSIFLVCCHLRTDVNYFPVWNFMTGLSITCLWAYNSLLCWARLNFRVRKLLYISARQFCLPYPTTFRYRKGQLWIGIYSLHQHLMEPSLYFFLKPFPMTHVINCTAWAPSLCDC